MLDNKAEVLEKLATFTHGSRTNIASKVMTNHDAAAFLFWHLGTMKVREITGLLQAWRGTKPSWYDDVTPVNLQFTYMFNMGDSGGYGFVATNVMQRGNVMCCGGGGGSR